MVKKGEASERDEREGVSAWIGGRRCHTVSLVPCVLTLSTDNNVKGEGTQDYHTVYCQYTPSVHQFKPRRLITIQLSK